MSEQLKPAVVHARGASIEVVDAATGVTVQCFPVPQRGKPGLWVGRVVRALARRGYAVQTVPSVAGGGALALKIG